MYIDIYGWVIYLPKLKFKRTTKEINMSQVKTITLRTDDDTLDLNALVTNFSKTFPGVTASAWKKKGKHVNKKSKVESESVVA